MGFNKFRARFYFWVFLSGVAPVAWGSVDLVNRNDWRVYLGGFAQLDMFVDSTRSLLESIGNGPIATKGNLAGDFGRTIFSMRNSRLLFGISPPVYDEWETLGYLEGDFLGYEPALGAINEANFFTTPTFRLRLVYGQLEKDGLRILAGQNWSLFGWQPIYVPATLSVAPAPGEVYQRIPQFTVIQTIPSDENTIQLGISLVRPPQRDAQVPRVDVGLRYAYEGRRSGMTSSTGQTKTEPLSIAISGTVRDFVSPTSQKSNTHYLGYAGAVDFILPIVEADSKNEPGGSWTLMGEFTAGKGYGDLFNGWSGNLPALASSATSGVNLDPGLGGYAESVNGPFQLLTLRSYSVTTQYTLEGEDPTILGAGYNQLFSSNVGGIKAPGTTGEAYDRAEIVFVNVMHDFTPAFRMGAEFSFAQTHYVDNSFGYNYRSQVSSWYRF